jgi:hypothetical protein
MVRLWSFFFTKLYRHHIEIYMSGSEYLLWSYGQFEKMTFFPQDPLLDTRLLIAGISCYLWLFFAVIMVTVPPKPVEIRHRLRE